MKPDSPSGIKHIINLPSSLLRRLGTLPLIFYLQFCISFALAIIILFPNLSAQWGMIDDHQIISYLGVNQHLSFRDIPSQLMNTEVGTPTEFPRYRPSYFLVRLAETAIWGNNPFLWYLFRILLFGLVSFITWRLLGRAFGTLFGGLAVAILLSHRYWADIWTRLGPSETYCAVGLAFYCLAFYKLWVEGEQRPNSLWWAVLTAAAVLSMGSKENFLLLIPVSTVLLYRVWRQKRLDKLSILFNIILYSFGLFVTTVIVIALKTKGMDIYANSVDPQSRFAILKVSLLAPTHWKFQLPFLISLIFMAVITVGSKIHSHNMFLRTAQKEVMRLFWIELFLLILWYSQVVFYNGILPKGNRYDFPGVLTHDLAYLFLSYFPIHIMRVSPNYLSRPRALQAAHIILCGVAILFIVQSGYKELKMITVAAAANSKTTRAFSTKLHAIVEEVAKRPITPIIFESYGVWDIEPIQSLRKYLFVNGIKNPAALRIEGYSEESVKPSFEKILAQRLIKFEKEGETRQSFIRLCPLESIHQQGDCFVISFSGLSQLPCNNLGRIW